MQPKPRVCLVTKKKGRVEDVTVHLVKKGAGWGKLNNSTTAEEKNKKVCKMNLSLSCLDTSPTKEIGWQADDPKHRQSIQRKENNGEGKPLQFLGMQAGRGEGKKGRVGG